jgi:hypothetical protein
MKDVSKFYVHLVYFIAVSYIYSHLVKFVVICGIFFPFWYDVPRKIWQPCCRIFILEFCTNVRPKILDQFSSKNKLI